MKNPLIQAIAVLAVSVATSFSTVSVAAPPVYPPRVGGLQVSKSVVDAGRELGVATSGFRPGGLVGFALRRTRTEPGYWLGQGRADRRGAVSVRLPLPARVEPGRWLLLAMGRTPAGRAVTLQSVVWIG